MYLHSEVEVVVLELVVSLVALASLVKTEKEKFLGKERALAMQT